MLRQAAENLRVITEKHKNGQAVLGDVLDARIAWLKAKHLRSQAALAGEAARLTYLHNQGLSWQPTSP
jgi:outer membrane protein TolC